mmetsp:Transcript_63087/g.192995  ORF Transcript_63087/g.192995 Transcript_63087/m.192995 type:complete len:372 (-) Transcript_63087:437-1552(-)
MSNTLTLHSCFIRLAMRSTRACMSSGSPANASSKMSTSGRAAKHLTICTSRFCSSGNLPKRNPASTYFAGVPSASPVPWNPAAASIAMVRWRRSSGAICLANWSAINSSTVAIAGNTAPRCATSARSVSGSSRPIMNRSRRIPRPRAPNTRMIHKWTAPTAANSVEASIAINAASAPNNIFLSSGSTFSPRFPGFRGFSWMTTRPEVVLASLVNKRAKDVLEAALPPATPTAHASLKSNCKGPSLAPPSPTAEAPSKETIKCLSVLTQGRTVGNGSSGGASSSPSMTVLPPNTWPQVSLCFWCKSFSCARSSARSFPNSRAHSALLGSTAKAASKSAMAPLASASWKSAAPRARAACAIPRRYNALTLFAS